MTKLAVSRIAIIPLLAVLTVGAACRTPPKADTDVAMPGPVVRGEANGTAGATGTGSTGDRTGGTGGLNSGNDAMNGTNRSNLPPVLSPEAAAAAAREAVITGLRGVGDRVFFETDSSGLTESAQAVLRAQAGVLRANPSQQVMVAGNCDERGTREYNLALGARRAAAVRDYLVTLGVSPSQINTVSYGKERPIDDRPNMDGWAINRNGHTFVLGSQ